MNEAQLQKLSVITDEEKEILSCKKSVNRALYYSDSRKDEIDSSRVLRNGKLIDIRPHTRFIRFPRHTHNYVEFIYMVKGQTRHIIDDEEILLKEGDLLFLNQHAIQEIFPAGKEDIAVNFMILPQFFDEAFKMISAEQSSLRDFIISCLTGENLRSNYLYFHASGIVPIQNLLENLIWNLLEDEPNKRSLNQITMGLLFLSMINHSEEIRISESSFDRKITMDALRYIDTSYHDASLTFFAESRGLDVYTVSRIIKKQTGSTFKALLEAKRMNQAAFLLKNTSLTVEDIATGIGYENLSFFYRLFMKTFGKRPREYRLS
ncbi:MAG: helix-turn-helix domain-containing protein [Erysipelotrichaceae bacterium]|nr:helix-turn-helix domain-containing protein [Erysipelotrichaceae bacterium]